MPVSGMSLSAISPPIAITSKATITTLIFLPVSCVTDRDRSTSTSRFSPSGVISYTHAKISAGKKPSTSSSMTIDPVNSGTLSNDDKTSVSCNNTHDDTR